MESTTGSLCALSSSLPYASGADDLFKGREVQQTFSLRGKDIGRGVAMALEWQMLHPASSNKEACADYVRRRIAE